MEDPSTPSAREETVTFSDRFPCSMATIAVMILVTLAMDMRRRASFSYNNRPESASNRAADRALTTGPGEAAADAAGTADVITRIRRIIQRIDVRRIPSSTPACTLYMYMPGQSDYEKQKNRPPTGLISRKAKTNRCSSAVGESVLPLDPYVQSLKCPCAALPNASVRGRPPAAAPSIPGQNRSNGRGGGSVRPG